MSEAASSSNAAEAMRGDLFSGLDRLAFALEMEAADAVDGGDSAAAARLEDQRLGVRLAQRLVAGAHADEVDPRIERTRSAYDRRTGASGHAGADGADATDGAGTGPGDGAAPTDVTP